MKRLFLNPAHFRWLDRLPAPRFARTRKPPFVQPHAGRHVASQPRLPQRRPIADRAPWPVASTAELERIA